MMSGSAPARAVPRWLAWPALLLAVLALAAGPGRLGDAGGGSAAAAGEATEIGVQLPDLRWGWESWLRTCLTSMPSSRRTCRLFPHDWENLAAAKAAPD